VWTTAPALLVPPPWRYVALGAAGVYSVAFAGMRMLTGGHFLSDVIFAAIFTGLVIWTVHGFLFRWPATRLEEDALNAMLEKLGRSVARIFIPVAQSRGARPDKQTPPV
jgi:membrane-associated phospholipid phosphatase